MHTGSLGLKGGQNEPTCQDRGMMIHTGSLGLKGGQNEPTCLDRGMMMHTGSLGLKGGMKGTHLPGSRYADSHRQFRVKRSSTKCSIL
jgi:hypothetical protein